MKLIQALRLAVASAALTGVSAIKITKTSYTGPGCPANSIGISQASSGSIITFIFDQLVLDTSAGPATNTSCELKLDLSNTAKAAVSLLKADIRGYASVGNGVIGSVVTTATANVGVTLLDTAQKTYFTSAKQDDYITTTRALFQTDGKESVTISFKADLLLASVDRAATGLITVDSIDLSLQDLI
jgi:hypothetical protein